MQLVDRVLEARRVDAGRYVPFRVDGHMVGRVRRDLAERLHDFPGTFVLRDGHWGLVPALDTAESRTAALEPVARELARRGLLTRWRDETYDIVPAFGAPAFFRIERAAVRFFGFESFAVHVNGIVGPPESQAMWIARRSDSKPIDPGMYDNLIGGGLASGLSVRATVVKEAFEEAGIGRDLAACARPCGAMRVAREVPEGLHAEIIFAHDLPLPEDFVPVNQDGEVAQFRRLSIEDVMRELEAGAPYTADAGLVIVHFLVRHGHVTPDDLPGLVTAPFL